MTANQCEGVEVEADLNILSFTLRVTDPGAMYTEIDLTLRTEGLLVPPFWLAPEAPVASITLPPTVAPARNVATDGGGGDDASSPVDETDASASAGGLFEGLFEGEASYTIVAFIVVGALLVTLVMAVMVKQGYGCFRFNDHELHHDHLNHSYGGFESPPGSPYSMSSPIPLSPMGGRSGDISMQTSRLDDSLASPTHTRFHRAQNIAFSNSATA